ncbi:MAG: apolipoprotein N-acyltransferase [Gemmatimonadota bacterium]|nr:apolipoprotein N-acyltransferase [Gemmatimonadota bacterium]
MILASSALFAISFPPFRLIVPVFLCLVPLAIGVAREADGNGSARSAARMGAWFGFVGYGCNLYWIAVALAIYTKLAILGYVAALVWLTPWVALMAVTLFWSRRATHLPLAMLLPFTWVAHELVLNYLSDLSFPWLPLGLGMTSSPVMVQIAELSGVRGVSFWIAMTSGLLADAWLLRADRGAVVRRVGSVVGAAAIVGGFGVWRLSTIAVREVAPIGIIQPNVPQDEKWQAENRNRIVEIMVRLTRQQLAGREARLILWPEAALPGFMPEHPEWTDSLAALARPARTPILVGALDLVYHTPKDFDYYNAAMLVDSTGRVDAQPAYHKSYLVPIVERVPFLNPKWFGDLKWFGGYGIGRNTSLYAVSVGRFGVLICYESIFPQRSLLYRREGADFLVNITNDAWFGRTLAPYQHEAHLTLRAIENRVGIVRAANTGISGYIDPFGRLQGATALYVEDARIYHAQTTSVRTLYVNLGDWVGLLCVAATLALCVLHFRPSRSAPWRARDL